MIFFLFLQLFCSINLSYVSGGNILTSFGFPSEVVKIDESDCICRLRTSRRIVGGEIAEPNSIPWQVSLAYTNDKHFCGATIINKNYVLTAAHCIRDLKTDEIKVRIGLHELNDPDLDEKTKYVEKIIVNSGYDGVNTEYDLTLLKLNETINFIPGKVEPACLNFIEKQYPEKLMISGWGRTVQTILNSITKEKSPGEPSPVLKIAYLNQNTDKYPDKKILIFTNSDKDNSACFGDSGGPLHFTENGRTSVQGVLAKMVSYLKDTDGHFIICSEVDIQYSVRLSNHIIWFKKELGDNYCSL